MISVYGANQFVDILQIKLLIKIKTNFQLKSLCAFIYDT